MVFLFLFVFSASFFEQFHRERNKRKIDNEEKQRKQINSIAKQNKMRAHVHFSSRLGGDDGVHDFLFTLNHAKIVNEIE